MLVILFWGPLGRLMDLMEEGVCGGVFLGREMGMMDVIAVVGRGR